MRVESLVDITGADFFTGVPDSQLRALCDYLIDQYGQDPRHHVIAANEGNCTALAAGYHLATGRIPVVYMQNSGQGNIINPAASLLNERVYGIPCIFIVGWRGEPGVHDEPQHIYQGEITLRLFQDMEIETFVISRDTTEEALRGRMAEFKELLEKGKSVALVVRKGALQYGGETVYRNGYGLTREEIIRRIVQAAGEDPIISTTGKASRELFEIREEKGQGHQCDFLTVGSMGHSSSIALGVALHRPDRKVWCIDGDGAMLMHMGAMAVLGQAAPANLVHIVINNGAHESVGGMPTAAGHMDLLKIAQGCGYQEVYGASELREVETVLMQARENNCLTFIEIRAAIGARENLGRPTTSPAENKKAFMSHLRE